MSTISQQTHEAIVMIVDDNHEFLEGVELTLEMEGFKVLTAANGQEALDVLERAIVATENSGGLLQQVPDIILADIMMPVMDGYEFYDKVQADPYLNTIPFVFISAKSGKDDVRFGKELGPDDYLTKPCTAEDMLATIRGKLKRGEQRKTINDQIFGSMTTQSKSGGIIAIAIVSALIIFAFCMGILVATYLL